MAARLYSVINRGTLAGADFDVPNIREDDEPEYPSEFFAGLEKPKITFVQTIQTDSELMVIIKGKAQRGVIKDEDITPFMLRFLPRIIVRADQEWRSFGIVLAHQGQHVSPMNLLELDPRAGVIEGDLDAQQFNDEACFKYFWSLISFCRTAQLTDQKYAEYLAAMRDHIRATLNNAPFNAYDENLMNVGNLKYNSIANSVCYNKIIAVIDMFMCKYKNQMYASIRVSTCVSRGKGCSIISILSEIVGLLNIELSKFLRYIYSEEVAVEVINIMREGQELGVLDSYAPYMMDLGICKKSPYSLATNKNLCTWINLIGTFLGLKRSMNAIIPSGVAPGRYYDDALILAYHLGTKKEKNIIFVENQARRNEIILENEMEGEDLPIEQTTPEALHILINMLTDERRRQLKLNLRRGLNFDGVRDKTFGRLAYNYFNEI